VKTFVVSHRSALGDAVQALVQAVPAGVRDCLRGPVSRISAGETKGRAPSWPRPFDIVVPAGQTLTRRISIPRAARGDLAHAIELFIRHDTPFEPGEVVIHAEESPHASGDDQAPYLVRLVPRQPIENALRALGGSRRRVRRILLTSRSATAAEVDIAPAFLGPRYLRSLAAILPIGLIAIALVLLAGRELTSQQAAIAHLEATIAETRAAVQLANRGVEKRNELSSGQEALAKLVTQSPPVLARLELVRQALPLSTEISRIAVRGTELRLTVRSDDVLADAQLLGDAAASWESSIEGALSNDPASGREVATILLRQRETAN
jgi:general secretion pathway protein L